MFSTLSKGNVLYGLDRTDKIKWFTASVESVTPTIGNHTPNMFGQMPELRLDIVCNINGEKKTFQQVPSNSAIADFGDKAFVIADNKDSIIVPDYVEAEIYEEDEVITMEQLIDIQKKMC